MSNETVKHNAELNGRRPASDMTKRERIATEALAGVLSRDTRYANVDYVGLAIDYADTLLEKLEREE